jgi:esterase FrsA
MRKSSWVLFLLVFLLLIAVLYREPLVLRLVGMRPFVEERFDGWVRAGAHRLELDEALGRIHDPTGSGPGSWVYELSIPAAEHEERARQAEAVGDQAAAAREFRKAAVFYHIARFPFIGSAAKAEAYRKHIECYLKSIEYGSGPGIEVVRIDFEGEEIIGYLRRPVDAVDGVRPPVVVLTGGVDTWKSDVELQAQAILAEELAVFAFDMPGTGESAWPLSADADRVYSRVVDHLKGRSDLDGDRIGVYLQSFAGLYAVKLALIDPDVKAAVNVGGPIHLSFTEQHAKTVAEVMVRTIAHAMRDDVDQPIAELVKRITPFSLEKQGLLVPPERQAALLSINGDQDPLVTIEDLYIISRSGIEQEEWVYEGDGHCASRNSPEHVPRAAAWLRERLLEVESDHDEPGAEHPAPEVAWVRSPQTRSR